MATHLYETLEVSMDATTEQIRKAYKKKALQTHPDRLPPGSTPEQKSKAEDEFRKVNNAYEVLSDPQNRRVYDLHGVWPPPEPETQPLPRRDSPSRHRPHPHHYHTPRSHTYSDPFFGNYDPFSFAFTDPFALFDSIFGDMDALHHSSQYYHHDSGHAGPFSATHRAHTGFENMYGGNNLFSSMGSGFRPLLSMAVNFPSHEPASGHDRWAGESFMTTTINGVTQSVRKRRDWDGNEHVTRTFPDGREVHSINGIEQPPAARGYISSRPVRESRHSVSPATASQPHITSPRSTGPLAPSYPPPPYSSHPSGYGVSSMDPNYRHHHRRFSETRPGNSGPFAPGPEVVQHEDGHRKRWWRGGR